MKKVIKKIFPQKIIDTLISFSKTYLDGYATKSYSQEGEDMILRRIFEKQQTGFYIDVGAHHPKRFSNTYFFYKKGWSGINIDAMPGSMNSFNKIRPRDMNLEIPISNKKHILTYYAFNEPALNGFSKKLSQSRDGKNNYKILFTKNIETNTLEEILDNSKVRFKVIDFLSIDVEGLDFEVIQSVNLDKYRPRVILIEILSAGMCDIESSEIYAYLNTKGYYFFAKSVYTVIFKDNLS
jgi:FkbM family methyltransferase